MINDQSISAKDALAYIIEQKRRLFMRLVKRKNDSQNDRIFAKIEILDKLHTKIIRNFKID